MNGNVPLLPLFDGLDPATLLDYTPAIHIRSRLLSDQANQTRWIRLFGDNIFTLAPLPHPDDTGLEPIFSDDELTLPAPISLAQNPYGA